MYNIIYESVCEYEVLLSSSYFPLPFLLVSFLYNKKYYYDLLLEDVKQT